MYDGKNTMEFMVFLWYFYGISMVFHGISMGFLWYFYGISMVFLWDFYGISMVFRWDFYGISMVFLWYFIAMKLRYTIAMVFHGISWDFDGPFPHGTVGHFPPARPETHLVGHRSARMARHAAEAHLVAVSAALFAFFGVYPTL